MTSDAVHHLRRKDPALAQVIRRVGPCTLRPRPDRTPFESLVRAVAHQQLHGNAAEAILARFRALFAGRRFPSATALGSVSDLQLRAVGFSGAKIAAIRDIAERVRTRGIPGSRVIAKLDDEEIVRRLTAARGVGRWTVEMLLIFKLGRPDVLPVDDFGVRNGFRILTGGERMPTPRELLAAGERWRPHRTTAAWYLWRLVDLERGG